jgi:hypothetical protein
MHNIHLAGWYEINRHCNSPRKSVETLHQRRELAEYGYAYPNSRQSGWSLADDAGIVKKMAQ